MHGMQKQHIPDREGCLSKYQTLTLSTIHLSFEQQRHGKKGQFTSKRFSYARTYVRFLTLSFTKHPQQIQGQGANFFNLASATSFAPSRGFIYLEVPNLSPFKLLLRSFEDSIMCSTTCFTMITFQ